MSSNKKRKPASSAATQSGTPPPSAAANEFPVPVPVPVFAARDRLLAGIAGAVVIVLLLLTRPFAEVPRNDDFSYAHTARVLAETGRIVYNGWGSPMLLPQTALGALIVMLFGFSYNALGASGIVFAGLTAAVMYALARRCGIAPFGSLLATAALTLNPAFLPVAPSFMTDVPSLFLLLIALLMLASSLQASAAGVVAGLHQKRFLISVFLGLLAGSNRQISWVAFGGALLVLAACLPAQQRRLIGYSGAGMALAAALLLRWFAEQPYTVPVNIGVGIAFLLGQPAPAMTGVALMFIYKILNMMGLFLLPMALLALRASDLRRPALWALMAVCFVPVFYPLGTTLHLLRGDYGLAQTGKYFTSRGVVVGYMHGLYEQPKMLPDGLGHLFVLMGAVGLALSLFLTARWWKEVRGRSGSAGIRRFDLTAALLLASSLAQILASIPFFAATHISERYMMYYIPGFAVALLAREARRGTTLTARRAIPTAAALSLLLGMAVLGFGFTYTYMNYTRAQAALFRQLIAQQGARPEEIDGGFEWDADTQVRREGFINNETMLPRSAYRPAAKGRFVHPLPTHFPALDARYALSLDPMPLLDFAFAPEPVATQTFDSFFPPRRRTMYALRVVR